MADKNSSMNPTTSTVKHALLIPALQGVTTGVFIGLLVYSLSLALSWRSWSLLAAPVGIFAALIAWLYFRAEWARAAGFITPAQQAEPEEERTYNQTVKLEILSENARRGDYLYFEIELERLESLARGLAAGEPLTTRRWTGAGNLFSGQEFSKVTAELIKRGLVRQRSEKDPRGGMELTAKGRAVMRGLALMSVNIPPPLLTD